jgi:hypothetical protein
MFRSFFLESKLIDTLYCICVYTVMQSTRKCGLTLALTGALPAGATVAPAMGVTAEARPCAARC